VRDNARVLPLAAALTGTTIPVLSAIVAGVFAARLGGSCVARPSPQRAFWALGFLLFAGGSAAEAYGASGGWGPVSFRLYYLLGGVLAVGFLGLGSAWLHLPRSAALVLTGALLACVPAATISVLGADLDAAALRVGGLRPPPNDTLQGLAFLWAVALNSFGAVALVGGSLHSIWRGRRRGGNALIVAGVLVVSLSGLLTRAGSYGAVYAGQLLGLALIFAGVELAASPGLAPAAPRRRPRLGIT
jgi:hypothetical protein